MFAEWLHRLSKEEAEKIINWIVFLLKLSSNSWQLTGLFLFCLLLCSFLIFDACADKNPLKRWRNQPRAYWWSNSRYLFSIPTVCLSVSTRQWMENRHVGCLTNKHLSLSSDCLDIKGSNAVLVVFPLNKWMCPVVVLWFICIKASVSFLEVNLIWHSPEVCSESQGCKQVNPE